MSLGQAAGSASAHVDKIVKGMEDIRLNMDQVAEKIQTLNIIGYFKKVMVGGLIIFAFLISSGAAGTSTGLRFFASLLGWSQNSEGCFSIVYLTNDY